MNLPTSSLRDSPPEMSTGADGSGEIKWLAADRRRVSNDLNMSEAVRLSTIQLLGLIAICTGLLVAITAPDEGPSFVLFHQLIGWPILQGSLLAATGVLQVYGAIRHQPTLAAMTSGLSSVWYLTFAVITAIQWVQWTVIRGVDGPLEPSVYPVATYLGLASLHAVQGLMIVQKRKAVIKSESIAEHRSE